MAQILPSINCPYKDFEAVTKRCQEVADIFATAKVSAEERWAHFDVADGMFTFNKSWDEPEHLKSMEIPFAFEAHLMVEDPRAAAERWLAAGARRLLVHAETATPAVVEEIIAAARSHNAEVGLVLNPETAAEALRPYLKLVSYFTILAVHPGLSGQKFLPMVLEKVSFLRREVPNAKIEVDGGIDVDTAHAAIAAGADVLVSGSDIFGNSNPEGEYEKLRAVK